jgi:pimeloyl-ACP methyl ester carboxylesterase
MRAILAGVVLLFATFPCPSQASDHANRFVLESFQSGSGPPLVMLGGGIRGADEFIPHATILAANYRIIRLQTLSFTRSRQKQPLSSDYSLHTEVDAVDETLNRLGVRVPADFIGHSLGALIALQFALEHPERVRTLTLAEPPAFWVVPKNELQSTPDMRAMYELLLTLGPQVEPTDDQLIRFRCLLGECDLKKPEPGSALWQEWAARRAALRGLSAIAQLQGDANQLKSFRKPVLIVTGTRTVSFHRRIDQILATQCPVVEGLELPGNHAAVVTAQDEFLNGLRSFLERHR